MWYLDTTFRLSGAQVELDFHLRFAGSCSEAPCSLLANGARLHGDSSESLPASAESLCARPPTLPAGRSPAAMARSTISPMPVQFPRPLPHSLSAIAFATHAPPVPAQS